MEGDTVPGPCREGWGAAKHGIRHKHSGSPKRRRPSGGANPPTAGGQPAEADPTAHGPSGAAPASPPMTPPPPKRLAPCTPLALALGAAHGAEAGGAPAARVAVEHVMMDPPTAMVSMSTGAPLYVAESDRQRGCAEMLVPVSRYDAVKVQGLVAEARRLALAKKKATLRELRRQLADAEIASDCTSTVGPDSDSLSALSGDCASDCASSVDDADEGEGVSITCDAASAVCEAKSKVDACVADIRQEMRWWREFSSEVATQLHAGVPAMQIICDFSVRKIFLR